MKHALLFLALLLSREMIWAQKNNRAEAAAVQAKVDPRAELMSIVARLAGLGGYDSKIFQTYLADIQTTFGKDSLHPAVLHLKELGKRTNLGWDAIAKMAIHFDYPSFTPRTTFSETIPERRWTKEGAEAFLPLLKRFYEDTNFERFFEGHQSLYSASEKRLQSILDKVDFSWFERFYGAKPQSGFYVTPGLTVGTFLYGPNVVFADGSEEMYAVMPTYLIDAQGVPVYEEFRILPYIVHEFGHSFVNHLILRDTIAFQRSMEKIFRASRKQMEKQYYTSWPVMLYESLIRAAVIRYKMEHDTSTADVRATVDEEYRNGFIWIEGLVSLFGLYEQNRKHYTSFASFLPSINAYMRDFAKNFSYWYDQYAEKHPKVIATLPFQNGDRHVDPAIREFKVIFSQPMTGNSFNYSGKGKDYFPFSGPAQWDETRTQCSIKLNLKQGRSYEFILSGLNFKTREGYSLEDQLFEFHTK